MNHLLSENGKNISIGRLVFWILTFLLLYFWVGHHIYLFFFVGFNKENTETVQQLFKIPDGLLSAWITSLTYNAYKKLPLKKEKPTE